MFNYFRKKIAQKRLKKRFEEYGSERRKYPTEKYGVIEFAQWLHPFEGEKIISDESIDFYRQFLQEGDTAIDIGAHSGDTTVPMAVAAGREGCVIALEPNKYVYRILAENAALNGDKTNITPLCYAATQENGEYTFHYSDASFCNGGNLSSLTNKDRHHKYELKVKGIDLQSYLLAHYQDRLPRLKLVKIDAEGYDKEIIKSIKGILKSYRPYLITECLRGLNEAERYDLYDTVADAGYELYHLSQLFERVSFEQKSSTKMERQDMLKWKHFDILAVPVSI